MRTFPQPGAITLLATILITCLLLFVFQKIIWLVVPVLLALMLYYCLRPAMVILVLRGVRHETAAKFIWLLFQLMTAGIVLVMALLVLTKAGTWKSDFDRYLIGGQTQLKKTTESLEKAVPMFKTMSLGAQVDQNIQQLTDRFAEKNLVPIALLILKWLPSLLLVPYIIYFMLNDSARLKKYIIRSVPNAFFEKALLLFSRLDVSLQNYFQGLLLLTLLDTVCLALGLWMLGMADAVWLGLGCAVLAWIPYLGSAIGCIIVVLVAATDFPDKAWMTYACLALFLCVRVLDDFVFLPLTVGRKLHVHPLLSVLMLFLGATVAGATGLVLALPLFGVVAVIAETVSQIVADKKLRTRYRAARQLATGGTYTVLVTASLVVGMNAFGANESVTPSDTSSDVLKGLKAPASSETPWQPPDLREFSSVLNAKREPEADPQKDYELTELIDLAERINPETKIAWEQAKQSASAVGLAQSEYFPILALQASANYAREPVPVPITATKGGFLDLEAQQATPVATLEWVLLDFGRRKAAVGAAKDQLLAANLGFNARHQAIVFKVQSAFYELSKVRGRIDVAQSALNSALKVQEAAEERHQQGLATGPEVSQARQQAAQATFDLEGVQVDERDAQVTLAEAIGITPSTPLRVADFSRLPIPTNLEDSVEIFINKSLEQRPDLLAKVAILREREADIKRARADYYPTLAFQGEAGGSFDRARMEFAGNDLPWASTEQPTWGVGLSLTWSLFEGGARKSKLEIAKSERAAAQHELDDSRDKTISQVWRYYSDTKLAIRRLDVAAALVDASEKSYQQTFEAYQNGLSSLVDVLDARRALSLAQYTQLDTRATVLESTAALAFASGDLGPQLLKRKYGSTSDHP